MKKTFKKSTKAIHKKMDLKISLVNFNFVTIHIICKMLMLFKIYLYYLKDNIFEYFFKKDNRLLFF